VPLLPVIQEAVWSERKLQMTYQRGPGCHEVERLVDPLGLVAKGSAWYLVAGVTGHVRSYRVSRVSAAMVLDERCEPPPGFDLGTYWQTSATTFKSSLPSYLATFKVSPDVFPRLRFAGRFARVGELLEIDSEGWHKVVVRFDVEEMACEYALGFGANLEVVEPASLREKVLNEARKVVTVYDSQD